MQLTLVDQLGHGKEVGGPGGAGSEQEARRVAYWLYHNLRASRKRTYIQQSGGCQCVVQWQAGRQAGWQASTHAWQAGRRGEAVHDMRGLINSSP